MEREQIAIDFKERYNVEQMGRLISPNTIYLFESFMEEKLRVSGGLLASLLSEEEKTTDVGCPFCQEGFLKLTKVKPQYSGGLSKVPTTKHHVGNEYEYVCSNPKCDGRFVGSYTWMHID